MSDVELEHLIKMLNQIADNFASAGDEEEQAFKVADHMQRFWAPSMIQTISEYAEGNGEKLTPASSAALTLVARN